MNAPTREAIEGTTARVLNDLDAIPLRDAIDACDHLARVLAHYRAGVCAKIHAHPKERDSRCG